MKTETITRNITKTISYRTVTMFVLVLTGLLFAKDADWITKFVIFSWTIGLVSFFLHEWIWSYIRTLKQGVSDTRLRSVLKTITWRIWALLVVFLVSTLLLGSTAQEGVLYTIVSNFFFVTVHYLHERAWNLINFGRI